MDERKGYEAVKCHAGLVREKKQFVLMPHNDWIDYLSVA